MGDKEFDAFIKDLYETHKGHVANTEAITTLPCSHSGNAEVEKLIARFIKE